MKGYQIAPFGVRMEPDLKDWLTDQAQRNFRSLNAEIVYRLRVSRETEGAARCAAASEKENAPVVAATEASYIK